MQFITRKIIAALFILIISLNIAIAQNSRPVPNMANVKYGAHERNVFDIWFADTIKTTPLAIYIHGGGFRNGSKEKLNANELSQLLDAGISVAAINYRYQTIKPLPAAHNDAKQALQFIRSNANEWKIDKNKIAAFGGSAGAQICMWLAFSDDMANPESENPIERESTRLTCVATSGGQTTMDADFWIEHISKYAPDKEAAFLGKSRLQTYGAETLEVANEIAKSISALTLISADDPPIFMKYGMTPDAKAPNNPKKVRGWVVHHVDFGTALKEEMDKLKVEAHLKYPGAETKYNSAVEFISDKLLNPQSKSTLNFSSGKRIRDIVDENFPEGNVYIGATAGFTMTSEPLGQILAREFSYATPANDFKQTRIHPEPGKWDWEYSDGWVEFAEKNNQVIRIHGPISPQCSKWAMNDERTAEELEQNLKEYMTALCKRYNGHENVMWMDVINETVNSDGSWKKAKPGFKWEMPWEKIGYEKTPAEFKHLGGEIPKYIIQAFRIATEHAPDIKLVINQHLGMDKAAWNKVKDMVLYLRSIGCRVDGIGWQAHIKLIKDDPSQWETGAINNQDLSDLIAWAHKNELEFHITENNIHVKPEDEGNVNEHADVFVGIINTLLEKRHSGVVAWNLWTIKDTDHKQSRSKKVKIGLWDRELKAKKTYYEVQQLLENPPSAK